MWRYYGPFGDKKSIAFLPDREIMARIHESQSSLFIGHQPLLVHARWLPDDIIQHVNQCLAHRHRARYDDRSTGQYHTTHRATYLLTSGTQSRPKIAVHGWGNHWSSAVGANNHTRLEQGDRWLLHLPLFHVSGMAIIFRCALAGATMVVSQDKQIGSVIQRHHVTHVSVVHTTLYHLIEDIKHCHKRRHRLLTTLKCLLHGGSAIDQHLLSYALDRRLPQLPLFVSYGATEMSSQIATINLCCHKQYQWDTMMIDGSVAMPILPHCQVKIAQGRIWVKGTSLFSGYLHSHISTPMAILHTDKDGWFDTHDVGMIMPNGYLVVTARADTMVISGGENIQIGEVEHALLQHPHVVKATVFPEKNPHFGTTLSADVVVDHHVTQHNLDQFLDQHLPRYKIPKRYQITDRSLPSQGLSTLAGPL